MISGELNMVESAELLQLWAKKRDIPEVRYPLLFHMVDTSIVAGEMWDKLLQQGTRNYWSEQIGLNHEQARKIISFWAGLHDIGKASPAFQNQTKDNRHDILTAYILKNQFSFNKQIAVTLGGHHGVFPRSEELISTKIKKDSGSDYFKTLRQELFNRLAQIYGIDQYQLLHPPQNQAFFMFLGGLTSVADWIASNETYFPLDNQKSNIEQQSKIQKGMPL
jgi:CRISPR-associated endonuclease/helicase Cas3